MFQKLIFRPIEYDFTSGYLLPLSESISGSHNLKSDIVSILVPLQNILAPDDPNLRSIVTGKL